jgi:L-ascorbate metabolism protein UlaG (beta-lactamase superfamily)
LHANEPGYATTLQIRYLGAGGVLFQRGPDKILTAPFFSNPSLLRVALGRIETDVPEIDRFMRPIAADIQDTEAILVGHAHYDHLMDLPYIQHTYLPKAFIYGSDTTKYILAPYADVPQNHVISVEQKPMGEAHRSGKWWRVPPRIRFMAVRSEHAPIFLHHKFVPGSYDGPLTAIPSTASDWREGQTIAYVIDFLDDAGGIDYRIFYQDAGSTAPLGIPPDDAEVGTRRFDVAVLCMPGFDQVEAYPEAIVTRLNPRFVVGIHWENFFERLPDHQGDPHPVPTFDPAGFIARLEKALPSGASFLMPTPGTWLQFAK